MKWFKRKPRERSYLMPDEPRRGAWIVSMPVMNAVAADAPFTPPPGQNPLPPLPEKLHRQLAELLSRGTETRFAIERIVDWWATGGMP